MKKGDQTGSRSRTDTVAERLFMLDASDPRNPEIQDGEDATAKKAVSILCCHDIYPRL